MIEWQHLREYKTTVQWLPRSRPDTKESRPHLSRLPDVGTDPIEFRAMIPLRLAYYGMVKLPTTTLAHVA